MQVTNMQHGRGVRHPTGRDTVDSPDLEDAAQHPENVDGGERDAIPTAVHQPVCGLQ
jgi:hypothetical protein